MCNESVESGTINLQLLRQTGLYGIQYHMLEVCEPSEPLIYIITAARPVAKLA